ncbi:MAG TPA: MASE1 domain-containing protein [Vicinamibacterales bacterium]|nr:MASE1 domain-containing protein [Vicinamibacterales bacterium]
MTTQSREGLPDRYPTLPLAAGMLLFVPLAIVGNFVGLTLRYPELGAAVLFPPYAALTAALVVSPRRDWVWYILVGGVAHFVASWPHWPVTWVLLADVGNVARALTAVALLRWLFGAKVPRLASVRALGEFAVAAVFIAPAVGATIGAADIMLHHGAATYWRPWTAWFISNALTGLAMLPATIAAFDLLAGLRPVRLTPARLYEGIALTAALALTIAIAFTGVVDPRPVVLAFYAPLPVLIWAALRFGSTGASLALTAVAVAAILGVDHGHGPLAASSPDENLLALQMFVLLTSAPVLCLAAVATARGDMVRQVHALAERIIRAQEEERTRIARELHDDFGQRIASLSIGLSSVKRDVAATASPAADTLASLQQQTMALAKDLRHLSHELHPGVFEHVGFVEALRARCDEVTVESGVRVGLDASEDWPGLGQDTALCLYRIAQEALRNVVTHARATSARISLARRNGAIVMCVADDGQGFEMQGPGAEGGLGLASMRERVQMLGGYLELRTAPGAGTVAEVTLPYGDYR